MADRSSDNWEHTRTAWHKIGECWAQADLDTRIELVAWLSGILMMLLAVVGAFGCWGALFLLGLSLWWAHRNG